MREVNKTPKTLIIDDQNPEDNAMLQALYSRSNASVTDHLDKVKATGSGNFMSSFYVGYGHRSIGDCGSTTIFTEGVSNVLAKAFQDNSLYSGQESSTRYLDYSNQSVVDPYDMDMTTDLIERWLQIYLEYQPIVEKGLKSIYPIQENEKESVYDKAIRARSFDIMRGFLPVGVTTQLSWHTNLRQARDKLQSLAFHPVEEVQTVARAVHQQLLKAYPNSFKSTDMDANGSEVNKWLSQEACKELYYTKSSGAFLNFPSDQLRFHCDSAFTLEGTILDLLKTRPANAPIPKVSDFGDNFISVFVIDFGSFRDIQRHRNGLCPIPVVYDCGYGINKWYLENASEAINAAGYSESLFNLKVNDLLTEINDLTTLDAFANHYDIHKHQYLYPLGLDIECTVQYSFSQMVYVSELRSSQHVHPTLRPIAQAMGKVVEQVAPGMALHVDYSPDKWSIARGNQDITEN